MTGGPFVVACDLGTSGIKASIYDAAGKCTADAFTPYVTRYPQVGFHEQDPETWWEASVSSIRSVIAKSGVARSEILGVGLSGHSLGVVPLNAEGRLLSRAVPIWSDGRAAAQAAAFFTRFDENDWYGRTGNGFPRHLYSVFKILWLRENQPDLFAETSQIIGTKDYVNFRLTGAIHTDPSYASGSGVWNLAEWRYDSELMAASGLGQSLFPEVVPSHQPIGRVTAEAAEATGLPTSAIVVAGGVDNSCMALGARNTQPGRIYNSLGSSSWLAVSSQKPVLDARIRPYVFAHVVPGLFTSAVSIFAAGSSFRWVRDTICSDLVALARRKGADPYELMTELAATSPAGANGLIFNPSLAGGTNLDVVPDVRGGWIGLDLAHQRADLIRAAMEGVAMGLRVALDVLRGLTRIDEEISVVGGGSNSQLWRQILADVFATDIVKTNVDDQAAALGAAALAAVGSGIWTSLTSVEKAHSSRSVYKPDRAKVSRYERLLPIFIDISRQQAASGARLVAFRQEIEGRTR
jgi:xylulokinase